MKNRLVSLAFVMLFATGAGAQSKSFNLYNQVRFSGSPNSLLPLLLPLKIANETQLLNPSDSTPNATAIANFAMQCPAGVVVTLDLETWPYYPAAKLTNTINRFLSTISYFKSANATSSIGFYGVPPKQAYQWSSIDPVANPSGYYNWRIISDSLARMAKNVDNFQPSFYAYDADTISWRKMVDTTIAAIRRYSTTKPIYAYVWPQYHQGTAPLQLQFIDTAIWKYELRTLYDRADGAIIWTSNKDVSGNTIYWDPNMLWWQATKSFMVEKSLAKPFVLDSFGVKRTGNNEALYWSTSIDTTTRKFLVQRSADGISYQTISDSISPVANHYTQNTYQFVDNYSTKADLYYRLMMVNKDASVQYVTASAVAAAFTPGVLAVLRIGGVNGTNGTSGTTAPGTGGVPVHIDKYSVTAPGTFSYLSSIDLPVASASNIFASSSLNEGYITQSANKQWLSVMGYASKAASGAVYSTTANPTIARTLGLIKYDGTVDLSTALSNFPVSGTAATVQSSVTTDGTDLWCVTNQGNAMGVLYTTPGTTDASTAPSVIVSSTIVSNKSLSIFGGDLYYTANTGSRIGTVSASGGLPVTTGNTMTPFTVAAGSTAFTSFAPSQMVMFDLDASILGYDVIYVTNSSTTTTQAGVYKYCKNAAGQWVSYGTFGSIAADGSYFGITGEIIDGLPVLYVTRGITASTTVSTNQLVQLMESSGYNVAMSAAVFSTTDATVSLKSGTLRGVAFYPTPSYYYKGSGNLNNASSWGINIDGSGTPPADFSTDNQTFFVTRNTNASFSGDLTISGNGSKLIIGNGLAPISLTVPQGYTINAETDVYGYAGLVLLTATSPSLHYLAATSTVTYAGVSNQTVLNMAYGNFSNTNGNASTINGVVTVTGNIVQSGILQGSGTLVTAAGLINTGTLSPGNSLGRFTVQGNFANAENGTLQIELGGADTAGTEYDQLSVSGTAVLDGTLEMKLVNGFMPVAGQPFTVLAANGVSGTFKNVAWPSGVTGTVSYGVNSVTVTIISAVLSLKLVDFTASLLESHNAQLAWETAAENNVSHFEIEKSSDIQPGFVHFLEQKAVGTGNHRYQALDVYPPKGLHFYRLKMVDNDGHFTYSKTVGLLVAANAIDKLVIYPNPVAQVLTLSHAAAASNAAIRIIFVDGKTAQTQKLQQGAVQSTVNVSGLKRGWYLITITNGTKSESAGFVKE